MANLPIQFSGAMVRALLREIERPGTGKTQTRRVLTPQPHIQPELHDPMDGSRPVWCVFDGDEIGYRVRVSYAVCDRLWVRERARCLSVRDGEIKVRYEADCFEPDVWIDFPDRLKFKPEVGKCLSMGCYREASRITFPSVLDVRVQRLQAISEADARAEGVEPDPCGGCGETLPTGRCPGCLHPFYANSFRDLWESLNANRLGGKYAWAANPWVAAYSFRPILGNIDQIAGAA